jgi:hypothetical protein
MTSTPHSTRAALAAAAVVGLLATACTGSSTPSPTTPAATPAPSSSVPSRSGPAPSKPPKHHAKPAPKPKGNPVDPLTGLHDHPHLPVVSVKIDDTAPGRPQVNIDEADIVYVEQVEGGLTRLLAIFGSKHPYHVGYVRSTRPSDPDLLLQFGKITAAYSGGAHDSLPRMYRSGLKSWSNDAGAPYYSRVSRAASSYINLDLNINAVAKRVHTPRAHSIGMKWSKKPPSAGHSGKSVQVLVGGTLVDFRWRPKLHEYVRYIGGVAQRESDGKYVATPNVVVQKCRIVPHPQDTDVLGNPSQFTHTTGHGKVAVFRGGKRFDGKWSRKKVTDGTTLKLASNGKPLSLHPGGAWFVLAPRKSHINSH